MGRPLFTESIVTTGHSIEGVDAKVTGDESNVRRWLQTDPYPDDDAWWAEKELFVETFLEPTTLETAQQGAALTLDSPTMDTSEPKNNAVGLTLEHSEQAEMDVDEVAIAVRYTISEEELANTTLDTRIYERDDEFELAWDSTDEVDDVPPFELVVPEPHSDVSTPAPSTPIMEAHSPLVSVPSSPRSLHSQTLFRSTSPIVAPTKKMSTRVVQDLNLVLPASRSKGRVSSFVSHNPRTEIVL